MMHMPANRTRNTATAQRRQKQIEDCLYDNLLHTSWQSISVADICRQVGISRKAYYNYFKDKDDCFNSYIDRVMRDALLYTTQALPDSATVLEAAVIMLNYWKAQKPFLDIIVRNNLQNLLMQRHITFAMQENRTLLDQLSTPEVESDMDILSCCTAIQLTLVLNWYNRDFETPTEEMARKYLRILFQPMIPQPENPIWGTILN